MASNNLIQRVLITGGQGQIAAQFRRLWGPLVVAAPGHTELDITDREAVRRAVLDAQPTLVVNTAGFYQADQCEEDPATAFAVNALGAWHVALACRESNAALVHLSTDYVFGGDGRREVYLESDRPSPVNVYGASKLAGEHLVQDVCPRHYIVRTSAVFGVGVDGVAGRNFVTTMLRLGRERGHLQLVDDLVFAPTSAADLVATIDRLISEAPPGVYHVTNGGECSWYVFARRIFELTGVPVEVTPTTSAVFGGKAKRPPYSVLNSRVLPNLRPWDEALKAYLREVGELPAKS